MEQVYKKTGILFKLLPCLLATLIAFMTLYGSFVYASSDVSIFDGYSVSYSDGSFSVYKNDVNYTLSNSISSYDYILLFYAPSYNEMTIAFSNTELSLSKRWNEYMNNHAGGWSYNLKVSSGSFYYKNFSPSTISKFATFTVSDCSSCSSSLSYQTIEEDYIILSTHDIYCFNTSDSTNSLVFQAPTQEVGSQGIIAEQTQGVQMDKTLQEILGILPVVLVVILGLIAIRKGIVMIKAFLKKS